MQVIPNPYETVAQELKRRILALIPDHPEILEMTDAWDLFKIPGFNCSDLDPSLAQADAAFVHAKAEFRLSHSSSGRDRPPGRRQSPRARRG